MHIDTKHLTRQQLAQLRAHIESQALQPTKILLHPRTLEEIERWQSEQIMLEEDARVLSDLHRACQTIDSDDEYDSDGFSLIPLCRPTFLTLTPRNFLNA